MSLTLRGSHLRGQRVSVVIPVRNEAAKIRGCIEGILGQTVPVEEIVVLDSGSTDGTLEILLGYSRVRVLPIAPEKFNHGETRNTGVLAACGDWVVLTVGDARPADERWIEQLFEGVTDDEVAGVCGAQVVPHDRENNPAEWFRPVSEPKVERVQFSSPEEFDRLGPVERMRACSWDDVTSLYRRDVLLRIPFPEAQYGEDALWAKEALRAGHALVYNPAARVFHYHLETPDFAFKRALASMYNRYRSVGYLPEEPAMIFPIVRAVRQLVREPAITWRERMHWARYTIRNRLASRSAVRQFRREVAKGEEFLEALYERYCSLPPVPAKSRVHQRA